MDGDGQEKRDKDKHIDEKATCCCISTVLGVGAGLHPPRQMAVKKIRRDNDSASLLRLIFLFGQLDVTESRPYLRLSNYLGEPFVRLKYPLAEAWNAI